MRAAEFVSEKWSAKYKRSIDCSHPRGFSQKAHCAGRKKNEDIDEHIIKHGSGYRLVSKKSGKNLGDFPTKAAAKKHEREVQYFKHANEEEQLDELTFRGSQCTKDCSGHRAGYEWSQRKGGADAASWSSSFNKGAWLHNNGH